MQRQAKAYLLALTAVFFWSTIATATKLSLRWASPLLLVCYASAVSLAVLFSAMLVTKKLPLFYALSLRQWLVSLFFGALNPFAYYLLLFKAYDMLPAQQCQVINYSWAITMTLLSIPLLKQRVNGVQWLAILIGYCGVLVIATKGAPWTLHFDNPLGVGLTLFTTVLWALYWILNTRDNRDPVVGLCANFCCATPLVWGYLLLTTDNLLQLFNWQGMAGGIWLGLFEMGLSFLMWLTAMTLTTDTAKIAVLIFIAPIPSLFFIRFLLQEPIHPSTIAGLLFVLVALALQRIAAKRD